MYILGINPGHNSTACLLKDGKIISCVSEERFSRIKNHWGFPHKSIKYILETEKIKSSDIDYLVLGIFIGDSIMKPGHKYDSFMTNYTKKSNLKKIFGDITYGMPFLTEPILELKRQLTNFKKSSKIKKSIKEISNQIGIDENKIIYLDHHLAHAMSTCFNLPRKEKSLIFTLDGEGDYVSSTVNVYDGKTGKINRIATSEKGSSIGYLYAITTIYLGMKANQHEFKVMGLAPYAKKEKVDEVYDELKKIVWIDGLLFKSKFRLQYFDSYLRDKMRWTRFDNLAGGVQKLTEELSLKWVKNGVKKTGITNVALAGGVLMNVKVNQKISELPEVKNIFCMPSAGDESTAIGACFWGYRKYCEDNKILFQPQPIEDLYLGPAYDEEYIQKAIEKNSWNDRYKIKKINNINKELAKLLARGEIIARCSGKSEWGARALGNRSILSNASNPQTIRILNETIKDRDFWMPFTPSMLEEYFEKYAINPKKIKSPYMSLTFESTPLARKDIPAAMHPYDFTIRPQAVYKSWNPDYYEILEEYKKITGVGGILNTSFNLHGEPNVLTPEDAIHTVDNSDLKYLAMGKYLFEKK